MRFVQGFITRLRELGPYSKWAFKLGAALMVMFYIVGVVSLLTAPYVPNYFNAMTLYRGCLEAAPASLASGICAGLLGDLMLGHRPRGNDK